MSPVMFDWTASSAIAHTPASPFVAWSTVYTAAGLVKNLCEYDLFEFVS